MTLHHLPLADVLSSSSVWRISPLPLHACLVWSVWSAFCFFDAGCEKLASNSIFSVHHFQPQKKSFIRQMAPDYAKLQVDRLSFVLTLHHTMRSCSDWYDSLGTNTRLTPKNCVHTPLSHSRPLTLLGQQIIAHSQSLFSPSS